VGMPGVAGVFAAADLGLEPPEPSSLVPPTMARSVLAEGVVRFVGEPVAVVLAETRAQAADAAEAVVVEYEPLAAVADPEAALAEGAPLLFPEAGTNVASDDDFREDETTQESGEVGMTRGAGPAGHVGWDEALEGAEVVIRGRFVNPRVAPVPLETNGLLAEPDPETGGLTVWAPCQAPFSVRGAIATVLGLDEDAVRVIAPAVGGGFGAKFDTYPEQLVVAAMAHRLGRPVRYTETRTENMSAMTHGRAQIQEVELGATRDGRITGLRVKLIADCGAYPSGAAFLPTLTRLMASGVYAIPRIAVRALCVVTNTTPISAYRGAGRPEAAAMIERVVDLLAAEVGLDPVEVRRRNFIPPADFPHLTPTGARYDTGEYERAMDRALDLAGYEDLRAEQARRRRDGDERLLGIGVATYVEVTGYAAEFGALEVHGDGTATVRTGLAPHGQGHETALAQVVSGTLGIPFGSIRVVHSDTGLIPRGEGTAGSRSLQIGGSAVVQASRAVLDKARRMAAHLLEAAPDDVILSEDGRIGVAGAPDRSLSWAQVAGAANDRSRLPDGMEPGLEAESDFAIEGGASTYPFGCHVAVVEVDVQTGLVRPVRHVAVDDCGRILNPMLVDGQVHGGVGQGTAQALYEEVLFDGEGNPLTNTLMTYGMPSAADLGPIETAHTETPTPLNPLGAKGIGESGTIGSTPAVQNAVIDAVAHLGVRHIDMPLTPERVWRAIRDASAGGDGVASRAAGRAS
jgi:aerobic carbon-monoxide dehydrogenase large subunit